MQEHLLNPPSVHPVRIVHSSFGRLRVHLPDPEGQIVPRLRGFPGVTYAQASKWTENILILFNPRQTSAEAVFGDLQSLCLDASPNGLALATAEEAMVEGEPPYANETAMELHPLLDESLPGAKPVAYVTGLRRHIYQLLGWASVGMAVVGFIVPGIPGAPFVILAGYFFIRSSPKAHAWLLQSRWFGPILRDWEQQRGVRRSLKNTAVGLIIFAMVFILVIGLPPLLVATILVFEIIGLTIVLRLKVVEPTPPLLTFEPELIGCGGEAI